MIMADKKTTISEDVQSKALVHVLKTKALYESLGSKRKKELEEVYRETMDYRPKREAKWQSSLKVNWMNQVESIVTARITNRPPKYIVSMRMPIDKLVDQYYKVDEPKEDATPQEIKTYQEKKKERERFRKEVEEWATAVQDWLNFAFSEYDYARKVRLGAKSLVRYGNVYGSVKWRVEHYAKMRSGKIEKSKAKEYPDLQILSWSNVLLDPRYIDTADSPGVILQDDCQSKYELLNLDDDLFNIDKIKEARGTEVRDTKQQLFKIKISNVTGDTEKEVTMLKVDKYFGYFNETGKSDDECLYEIWVLNDCIVIKLKKIARIPVHSAGCFEDVEQHYSVGYLEPIIGLQREYNYKINSQIEYVNQSMNRSWIWDPKSGVDPKQLANLGPGSVIIATNGVDQAQTGLQQLQYPSLPSEYFAGQNEIRRDMQAVSFTVDTTAPTTQQGFTNTATAVRARFFESNVMYADTLKHYEEFLVKIAYDMIDSIAENADDDVIIGRIGKDRFKLAKKMIFDDGPLRYMIRAEVGASSFDSIDDRREEALALWTVLKEAKDSGTNIDLGKGVKEVLSTFEGRTPDDFIEHDFDSLAEQLLQKQQQGGGQITNAEAEQIQGSTQAPSLQNPAELTNAVVQGDLTA